MAYEPVALTPETLAELEAKHEDVMAFHGPEIAPWVYVVRRPNRQETIAYKSHGKRDSTTANEKLLRQIVVFPEGDALEKQLARWPLAVDALADARRFREFLGATVEEQVK